MAHDVFISYSSKDKTVADAVCHALEERGIRCFIAPRDIPPGTPYPKAIVEGIEGSRVLVLVFSGSANDSRDVLREVVVADSSGLVVLPFRIEDVPTMSKEMQYYLTLPHWLDAMAPPLERHLETLAEKVALQLGMEAPLPGAQSGYGEARDGDAGRPSGTPFGAAPKPRPRVAVGDPFEGGVVAYILEPGDPGYVEGEEHGLIAATADQSDGIQWATKQYWDTEVSGAVGTGLGTGAASTYVIIAQNGAGTNYAAGLARCCDEGGYIDWCLPSKDELDRLYRNREAIGGFATTRGDWLSYWSSSQHAEWEGCAWYQYFLDGDQYYACKEETCRVRAVRYF